MENPSLVDTSVSYKIVRTICEGGMGVVYEALQHGSHGFVKRVAIKVIREKYTSQPTFVQNFIGEAKLVADLIHTNIVQTYHLGEANKTIFIAMEFLHGMNLEEFCTHLSHKQIILPVELAVFIVSRVARGLAYAHEKTDPHGNLLGIVHRDISFKNIMVSFEGDVKLTDFGIAKAAGFLQDQEGEVVAGKADYMSPEQADFQITDQRSDLFSAGVVLAQLLMGYNVFKGPSSDESRRRILSLKIPNFKLLNKTIGDSLNQILHRCLQRDLDERYQTAQDLLYDLEHLIYHQGYGPTAETLGKFVRTHCPDPLAPKPQTA